MRSWSRRVAALAVLAGLTLGTTIAGTGVAGAQTDDDRPSRDDPRVITVNGTGLVSGTPDVLELYLGVDTRADSAGEALKKNSELTVGVLKVLRDAGVDEEDIQTTNLSISPAYDDDDEVVIAYSVSNRVVAKLRDLNTAGEVIDRATKAAGDDIVVRGLYFSIDDNSKIVERARAESVKRAKAQAEQLAAAAGVELGQLRSIDESYAPVGPALDAREAESPSTTSSDGGSVPIRPGTEMLSVDVTHVYGIA
jgi:uncharacterized protein YggE